jgi:hypothetical protein
MDAVLSLENPKGRDNSEDLGVDRRLIFAEWMLGK